MGLCLVMSLGTGADVEHGLKCSIQSHNPAKIIFLASEQSKDTLDRLRDVLPDYDDGRKVKTVILEEPDDVENCALRSLEVLAGMLERGAKKEEIIADFTSGTKAMTAGLCLAAVGLGLQKLAYVTGERDPQTGRVITDTERVLTVMLGRLTAHENKRRLVDMFNRGHFAEGLGFATEVVSSCAIPDLRGEYENFKHLFKAFLAWDLFSHEEALEEMSKVDREFEELYGIDLSGSKETLGIIRSTKNKRMKELVSVLGREPVDEGVFFPLLIADLLANAERRGQEGRYDDAAARLYRACEMVGQLALVDKGHHPSAINPSDIGEEIRSKMSFELPEEGRIALAMEKIYELLRAMGVGIGESFFKNNELRQKLSVRNYSILAHGSIPVRKEDYEILKEKVIGICSAYIGDLNMLIEKCEFPRISKIL